MRVRIVQACSLFCNSPFTTKSAFVAACFRSQHADVFDLRQPVGQAAAHISGHLGDEGIVARVRDRHHGDGRGPARKDQAGAQHPHGDRRAQDGEPRDGSEGALRRRLKSKKRFAGSLFVSTVAFVSGAAGSGWLTGAISGAAGTATSVTPASVTWARHLGLEQIAASRNDPDHLALVVAERGADFADALEQAVLADMDVRPDGFHQLLLA